MFVTSWPSRLLEGLNTFQLGERRAFHTPLTKWTMGTVCFHLVQATSEVYATRSCLCPSSILHEHGPTSYTGLHLYIFPLRIFPLTHLVSVFKALEIQIWLCRTDLALCPDADFEKARQAFLEVKESLAIQGRDMSQPPPWSPW